MDIKRLCLFLLLGIVWNASFCQKNELLPIHKDTYQQKGDFYFERYEYKRAVYFYNLSFKKDTSSIDVLLKMADAYSKLELSKQAETYYRKAFLSKYIIDNEHILKFCLTLLANGKLEESKIWLQKYNQSVDSDIRGKAYLTSIENRGELYKDSTIFFVQNLKEINTPESEISPVALNSRIIYAAKRSILIDLVNESYYQLYSSEFSTEGQLIQTRFYNYSLNSNLHEGPIAINSANSEIFITRNIRDKNAKNNIKLGIYKTSLPKKADEKLVLSPFNIPGFKYDLGHPTINNDGTKLYFISSSSDGYGGTDIYYSKLINDQWSYPENLGNVINTKGNEMFPFLFNDSLLYFASDGHGGLGGLDMFKVNLKKEPFKIVNLGYPINSSSDDFSLFISPEGKIGYFSSNRPGGFGSDDIYKVEFLNFKLNADTEEALKELKWLMSLSINSNNNDTAIEDTTIKSLTTKGFSIIPRSAYTLKVSKKDVSGIESEEMTIPLTKGVKYDFNSDASNKVEFDNFLENRKDVKTDTTATLDISLLSKALKIDKGEEFAFRILPDINDTAKNKAGSTIMLNNKTYEVKRTEKYVINVPYNKQQQVNIQTDISHLQKNFAASSYMLNVDTVPFFSEIAIDTTGLYKRFLEDETDTNIDEAVKELKWLMSQSIKSNDIAKEDTLKSLTARGFSIIPQSSYTLKVSKKGVSGIQSEEMSIPLTKGVKYDFNSTTDQGNQAELDKFLENRKDVKTDTAVALDISLLSKELKIEKGEEFTFSILPDTSDRTENKAGSTIILNNKTFNVKSNEKYLINVPYNKQQQVNIQTDISHLQKNFAASSYKLNVDTIPFCSEIAIDTTGLYKRFLEDETDANIDEAVKELKWLMSQSIKSNDIAKEDTLKSLTARGFSIIPQSSYTLKISKKGVSGIQSEEMSIPLTKGVKYDFNSTTDKGNQAELDKFLENRKDVKTDTAVALDISLLSKALKIEKGEEFAFSILPDSSDRTENKAGSTIILNNKTFNVKSNEKYVINVPYNNQQQVNIQTDISHLQKNFAASSYKLNVDTISFFSEISIDTTGLYKRFLEDEADANIDEAVKELKWLMSQSIKSNDIAKEDTLKSLTAKGFSIIPQSSYTLKVSKKGVSGIQSEEMSIPLTKGVKYDFNSTTDQGNQAELDKFLENRKDVKTDTAMALDISLLSKALKIEKGEEFAFSILPDTSDRTENKAGSTIILNNKTFNVKSNEKYVINVPYNNQQQVNIQTDISHLQKNFVASSYKLNVDTIPFFSEISIDTTGLYKRYLEDEAKTDLKNTILRQYMAENGVPLKDSIINVVILNFEFNKFSLHLNDLQYIHDVIIKTLKKNPVYYVILYGHTDIRGSNNYNYLLGDERAKFVKDFLVQKGIDQNRIKTFSFGKAKPFKKCPDGCDESIHKLNRRVEIVLFGPKL
jgi:outer membrane protein OmpA-like peptidoglycan-associated protein